MPSIKTILVTGSNGQLGQSLTILAPFYPQYQFTFISREDLNLSDSKSITDYFKQNQFDFIINCAAYTSVDKAEQEPELANVINHLAVKQLAVCAIQQNAVLIQISTDYVFDGTNHVPYKETNHTNPQSVYGTSKLKGEQAIQAIAPKAIIIRTSWVFSEFGQNFVKTMLKHAQQREQLNIIYDQIGSPCYAKDLAESMMKMIESYKVNQEYLEKDGEVQIYHYSNEGVCSWYDFAKAIFELSNVPCKLMPIATKDYPTPAKRPHYCLLDKAKIKQSYDLIIPYWKDSLRSCLKNLQDKSIQ